MKIDKTHWPLVSRILSPIRFHRMFLSLKFKLSDGSHASVSQSRLNQFILNELNCFFIEPERQQLASNKQRDVRTTFQRNKARGHLNENLNLAPIGMQISFTWRLGRSKWKHKSRWHQPNNPLTDTHAHSRAPIQIYFFKTKKFAPHSRTNRRKWRTLQHKKIRQIFFYLKKIHETTRKRRAHHTKVGNQLNRRLHRTRG